MRKTQALTFNINNLIPILIQNTVADIALNYFIRECIFLCGNEDRDVSHREAQRGLWATAVASFSRFRANPND